MSGIEVPLRGMSDSNHVKGVKVSQAQPEKKATFNRRKGDDGLSGQMYEILLCLLFLLQGIRQKEQDRILQFHLASNMVEAGDFDDVVFEYTLKKKAKNPRLILLQAKHTSTKITIGKLLSTPDKKGMFTLRNYFSSYLEIKKRFSRRESRTLYKHCDFIIFTNASFPPKFYKYHKYLTKMKVNKKSILHFKDKNFYYKLKLGVDKKTDEKILDSLGYASRCRTLAKTLVDSIFPIKKQNTLVIKYEGILKRYWYSLAQIVIRKDREGEGRLSEGFLQGDENLSIGDKKFREVFFSEIRKRKEHTKKSDNALISELKGKTLTLPENFGISRDSDRKFPLPSKLVKKKNMEDFLSKLKLYVNQPDLNDLTDYVKKKIQSAYQVNRKHIHPVFTELERKVLDWWMYSSKFLTETNKFIEEVLRNNIRFDVKDPVANFTGREQQLKKLHKIMQRSPNSRSVILQTSSVTGLGGVGKTELVRKYIQLYGQHYDNNIIWINAENWRTLNESFLRLAKDKLQNNVNDRTGNQIPIRHIVEDVYMFFCKRKSLFIFDNADRSEPLDALPESDYLNVDICLNAAALPSIFKKPNFLITSRNRHWKDIKMLELGTFTEEEAVKFVKRALNIKDRQKDDEVKNLAKLLQHFPLALGQAVAYIRNKNEELNDLDTEFEISDYMLMYKNEAKKLLNYKLPQEINDSESKTTYTTWKISIDKIVANEECGKMAKEILDMIAYCAPDDFPVEVFFKTDQPKKERKLGTAIQLLKNFSMVNSGKQRAYISIHRLVQEVMRLEMKQNGDDEYVLIEVYGLLKRKFPYRSDKIEDYPMKKRILPHLESVLTHMDEMGSRNPEIKQIFEKSYISNVLLLMSDACSDYGYAYQNKQLQERILDINERNYGNDHIEIAKTLVNLSNTYSLLGDHHQQKVLLERALVIKEAHYGKDHFEVARVLVNLGTVYGDLGETRQKKLLLERALGIEEAHYGKDHFKVARTLLNLGNAYGALGNPHQKILLVERALEIKQIHYGNDHFEVAKALVNLANAFGSVGDPHKKILLLERALDIQQAHYGKDNFQVAPTLVNLGGAYGQIGDPQQNKLLLERALEIDKAHYGEDSYKVAKGLVNLSNAYSALGDHHQQKLLLEQALEIEESHYGKDHVVVAKTLVNLGCAYGALGDHQHKKVLLERALEIIEAYYGKDHFEVAMALVNLGSAYGALGDPQKKKVLLERALEIEESHYGKDHFELAVTLVNLGNAHGALGDYQHKKMLLERALEIEEAHYGKDHIVVAKTLVNLAYTYGDLGDLLQVKVLVERALKIKEVHYGKGHFEVARTLVHLANTYGDLEDHQQKKVLLQRALEIKEGQYGKDHFEVAKTLVHLAIACRDLGDTQQQIVLLERALEIKESHFGRYHFQLDSTLVNLAHAYGTLGDPQKKNVLLRRALEIEEAHYGKNHIEVSKTLFSLGNAYGDLGDSQQKKMLLERALEIEEAHYGKNHIEVAKTLFSLGNAYGDLGDSQQKKVLLERALEIEEAHYGKDHIEVAVTLVNLAYAYNNLGDLLHGKVLLERALEIKEVHYGKDHFEVAKTLVYLGNTYIALANPQKGAELLEQALEIEEAHYGKDHFIITKTLGKLTNAYCALGNFEQQKLLLERALGIQVAHYGQHHLEVSRTLHNLSNAYKILGNHLQQKLLLQQVLEIEESHYGKDHIVVSETLVNLACAYGKLGDPQHKKVLLERALEIKEYHHGKDNFEVATVLVNLGNAYGALGDIQQKKMLLQRALQIEEAHYGKDHLQVATTLVHLGDAYGDLDDPQQKIVLLQRALEIKEAHYGKYHFQLAPALVKMGVCFSALSDHCREQEILVRALSICESHSNPLAADIRLYLSEKFNLHNACRDANLNLVKTLIDKGCDPIARDDHDTVLHQAVSGSDKDIIKLIIQEIIKKYPENSNQHLNASDSEGDTPLMWAAQNGKIDATKILLEYEVDVNIQNGDGETALHWASKGGYVEIAQLLLDNHVDHSIKDTNGRTALELAMAKLSNEPENDDFKVIVGMLLSLSG